MQILKIWQIKTDKILWKSSHIMDFNGLLKKLLDPGPQQSHIERANKSEFDLKFSLWNPVHVVVGIRLPWEESRAPKGDRKRSCSRKGDSQSMSRKGPVFFQVSNAYEYFVQCNRNEEKCKRKIVKKKTDIQIQTHCSSLWVLRHVKLL